ncbi:MAG: hypothetical protein M3R39_09805, partial [Actinomycetota bacterium]|nr:hypothetical protein [Actinomycetota bacterium]
MRPGDERLGGPDRPDPPLGQEGWSELALKREQLPLELACLGAETLDAPRQHAEHQLRRSQLGLALAFGSERAAAGKQPCPRQRAQLSAQRLGAGDQE